MIRVRHKAKQFHLVENASDDDSCICAEMYFFLNAQLLFFFGFAFNFLREWGFIDMGRHTAICRAHCKVF